MTDDQLRTLREASEILEAYGKEAPNEDMVKAARAGDLSIRVVVASVSSAKLTEALAQLDK